MEDLILKEISEKIQPIKELWEENKAENKKIVHIDVMRFTRDESWAYILGGDIDSLTKSLYQ